MNYEIYDYLQTWLSETYGDTKIKLYGDNTLEIYFPSVDITITNIKVSSNIDYIKNQIKVKVNEIIKNI